MKELNRTNEWNFLILHYLGLDHIGHSIGALNPQIQDKLSEMDDVINQIYSRMAKTDVLVITGDHGMIDQGGHGGSSYYETHVPTVFISNQFEKDEKIDDDDEYLQIDLTSTLSGLLRIPIPANNLGILIENVLKRFYHSEKNSLIKCLIDDNRRQLSNLLSNQKLPIDNLQSIRDQAMSLANQQDLISILTSLFLFSFVRSSLILQLISFRFQSTILLWIDVQRISFLSLFVPVLVYLMLGDVFVSLSVGGIVFCLMIFQMNERKVMDLGNIRLMKFSEGLLMIYPLFHLFSLFSTSFIEEEHQFWFYFLSTYFVLITIEEKSFQNFIFLILCRLIRSWNQTGNKWLHLQDIGDFINK